MSVPTKQVAAGAHSADQAVERTLQALRAVEPPPGLAVRVEQHLRSVSAMPPTRKRCAVEVFVTTAPLRWGLSGLCAMLLLFAFWRGLHRTPAAGPSATAARPQSKPAAAGFVAGKALTVPESNAASAVAGRAAQPPSLPAVTLSAVAPDPVLHLELSSAASRVQSSSPAPQDALASGGELPLDTASMDRRAAEDAVAPSLTAPALPPTAQERLVLLMLRRGERHELAALDPGERASVAADERASFHTFFEPRQARPELSEAEKLQLAGAARLAPQREELSPKP